MLICRWQANSVGGPRSKAAEDRTERAGNGHVQERVHDLETGNGRIENEE